MRRIGVPAVVTCTAIVVAVSVAMLAIDARSALMAAPAPSARGQIPFPDFGTQPPPEYAGPLFQLRQDYPDTKPDIDVGSLPWMRIPFMDPQGDAWRRYIEAVRDYAFEGNVEVDWRVEQNHTRNWYHVPWQHWGVGARELIHGLTTEALIGPGQLGPTQTTMFQTVAIGFYNEAGGYQIGRVWRDHDNPDPTVGPFPDGTVVAKLLFTDATPDQVPYLATPCAGTKDADGCGITWQAYMYTDPNTTRDPTAPRSIKTVRLYQVDLMVKDPRAQATGWTFATLAYNGGLANADPWRNLVPVGLMWGNDPQLTVGDTNPTPVRTIINPNLKQTVINPSPDLPPQHLGWGSRLAGPADNSASSCASCHMTAQWPNKSFILPPSMDQPKAGQPADAMWMRWFRNLRPDEPFDAGSASLDYSLQLTASIQNFYSWKNRDLSGFFITQYQEDGKPHPAILRDGRRVPPK